MDRNIFPEKEDKKEKIKPAILKEKYKKDITIEDIVMKNERQFSENLTKKLRKNCIDKKVKDDFH